MPHAARQLPAWLLFDVGQRKSAGRRFEIMRTKILFSFLLVIVFAAGVAAERRFFHKEKKVELHLKFDRPSGFVTAYTFYRDAEGREVKHGDSYEFDVSGRIDVRGRFEDGKEIGGRARFN